MTDNHSDYHKLTYFYYAEAYVNFNDLVTDLFKQYKVRIWMSAVNPASVVNPAGLMQIPPPSAIGPGAIIHSSAPTSSLTVGPGFGSSSYRGNEQQQQQQYGKLSFDPVTEQDSQYQDVAAATAARAIMTRAIMLSLISSLVILPRLPTRCRLGARLHTCQLRCMVAMVIRMLRLAAAR